MLTLLITIKHCLTILPIQNECIHCICIPPSQKSAINLALCFYANPFTFDTQNAWVKRPCLVRFNMEKRDHNVLL